MAEANWFIWTFCDSDCFDKVWQFDSYPLDCYCSYSGLKEHIGFFFFFSFLAKNGEHPKKVLHFSAFFLSKSFQCELTVTQQQMAYDAGAG